MADLISNPMADMTRPQLSIPPEATSVLSHCWSGMYTEDGLISVYHLAQSNLNDASVSNICHDMTAMYVHDDLGEEEVEDYHQFLNPITTSSPMASAQACVDHHFQRLDAWILDHPEERDMDIWPYGIIVLENDNWKNEGALLIHCDRICQRWYIGCIRLVPSKLVSELTSLRFGDTTFGDVCSENDIKVPQNDPDIDANYKKFEEDKSGAWRHNPPQFAVFSIGKGNANRITSMLDELALDAPIGHENLRTTALASVRPGENLSDLCSSFPKAIASDVRGEKRHINLALGPCRECKPLHPTIFVCVDKEDSQKDGVLVCRLHWDKVTDRSDDELEEIGRNAEVVTKRVGVAFAWNAARTMAEEDHD